MNKSTGPKIKEQVDLETLLRRSQDRLRPPPPSPPPTRTIVDSINWAGVALIGLTVLSGGLVVFVLMKVLT